MKIAAILAFLAFVGVPCAAQVDTTTYDYGEIIGADRAVNLTKLKLNVEFNFGDERAFFDSDRWKDPETGKRRTFNSMPDAMNFLALDGWQFIQAYTVPFTAQKEEVHFVVRRPKWRKNI